LACRLAVVAVCLLSPLFGLYAQQRAFGQGGGSAAIVVRPEVLRAVKHDAAAFTQGLICADTVLYESTGIVGRSSLRRVSASTGEVLRHIPVLDVFAEGITILNGELVQLTWQHNFALRYEYPSLRHKTALWKYDGEGWGLTNDGKNFIMSNGSDTLYFRDGKFDISRAVPVTMNGRPLKYINELQYARGHVYANIWYQNFIAEISVSDGIVRRIIDCAELFRIEMPPRDNVLNGIAYCETRDEWILTGKNWKNMFVVKIPK
jgi:glutamine cyclotransferase